MMDEIRSLENIHVGARCCARENVEKHVSGELPVEELEMPHELLWVCELLAAAGHAPRRCSELPAAERWPTSPFQAQPRPR